jgi:hypothetical protein
MSRSIRRFHAKRMKLKYLNWAYGHSHWWYDHGQCRWWVHGINYYPISHTPSWWIHDMHTVQQRADERRLLHRVLHGNNEQVWPLARKPHIYYW